MPDVLRARLEEQQREIEALRGVCASAYQLAGIVGAPVRFLDVLGDAANGEIGKRSDPEKLLPVRLDECDLWTAINEFMDSEQAREARE